MDHTVGALGRRGEGSWRVLISRADSPGGAGERPGTISPTASTDFRVCGGGLSVTVDVHPSDNGKTRENRPPLVMFGRLRLQRPAISLANTFSLLILAQSRPAIIGPELAPSAFPELARPSRLSLQPLVAVCYFQNG